MTLLYYDPVFLEHDTGYHPECAARLLPLVETRHFDGLDARCERPAWEPASVECLTRVHGAEYVARVAEFAAAGGGSLDPDTVVSRRSFDAARMAAGAVC
ncbi:MAG: histone deacetylase, partial [Pirellulaceae bacterium]|nr:histone deacetylase [Pirellulaceae bacterium]